MVRTPISAAGAPPRKTIAKTSARKLPEIFTFEVVLIAVRSLKTEKPSRMQNRAGSQLASCDRQITAAATRARAATMAAIALGVGRDSAICLIRLTEGKLREEPAYEFTSPPFFPA